MSGHFADPAKLAARPQNIDTAGNASDTTFSKCKNNIVEFPLPRVFVPLWNDDARYLCCYGGRGSGKSTFFASNVVRKIIQKPNTRILCVRQIQKSIKLSSKAIIESQIKQLKVSHKFEVTDQVIRHIEGDGFIAFTGLQDHNAASVKSLEGFDICWIEEAQSIQAKSWEILRPTIRKEGSQIWCSWNPDSPTNAIDHFFRHKTPEDAVVVQANWYDNPYFPGTLNKERVHDLKTMDPAQYQHVWEGAYNARSKSRVFNNVSFEEDFEYDPSSDGRLYYGVDWGFSNDPTAIVRAFIRNDDLYIDYAVAEVGVEMNDLDALFQQVPDIKRWNIVADNARPETISYMKNTFGYSKIRACRKGKNSVEEGVERLKSFNNIHVHYRATAIKEEFRKYSYKTDKRSGEILPDLEDKHNHCIDALRYALETVIFQQSRLNDVDFSQFA